MTKRTEPQREWGLTEDQHNMVTDVVATWRGRVDDLTAQLAAKQERIAALEAERDEWRTRHADCTTALITADRKIASLEQQGKWEPVPDEVREAIATLVEKNPKGKVAWDWVGYGVYMPEVEIIRAWLESQPKEGDE